LRAQNLDHLERARREEEAPYLKEVMARRVEQDRVHFETQAADLLAAHRRQWDADVAAKARTARMADDRCAAARVGLLLGASAAARRRRAVACNSCEVGAAARTAIPLQLQRPCRFMLPPSDPFPPRSEAFKAAVSERRAKEMVRLRAESDARRKALVAARKATRTEARKKEFVTRCRDWVVTKVAELEEEAKVAAEDEARCAPPVGCCCGWRGGALRRRVSG